MDRSTGKYSYAPVSIVTSLTAHLNATFCPKGLRSLKGMSTRWQCWASILTWFNFYFKIEESLKKVEDNYSNSHYINIRVSESGL